jgi:hypothetical protein
LDVLWVGCFGFNILGYVFVRLSNREVENLPLAGENRALKTKS